MRDLKSYIVGLMAMLCLNLNVFAETNNAQFFTFFIKIQDQNYVPTVQDIVGGVGGVTVTFSQTPLNDITANYTFRQFHLAFPNSTDEDLADIYLVEIDDLNYMDEIVAYDDTKFTDPEIAVFQQYYLEIDDVDYVPTYQYSNYVSTVSFTQSALNDIAADYTFNNFGLAFPNSTDPTQANIYLVGVNDGGFLAGVTSYSASVFPASTQVQYKKFAISVKDPSYAGYAYLTLNNQTLFSFNNSSVQAIANKYSILEFQQLYPGSELEHLREMYLVKCNDLQFMNDLINYSQTMYPRGHEEYEIAPLATSNDYGCTPNLFPTSSDNHQKYLDLINAQGAWDYSTGDPNLKIGVCDWYVNTDHLEILPVNTSGSKIYDMFSNNKSQFYIDPNTGTYHPGYWSHGTAVFGLIAGATNNGIGMASIGYNLRLGIYSHQDANTAHEHVRSLSQKGYRAINCSWGYGSLCRNESDDQTKNNFYISADLEDIYNEVYDNGGMAIFGAGNGGFSTTIGGTTCDNNSFTYPASLNHNISVTSVGSNVSQSNAVLGSYSVVDEHNRTRRITPDPSNPENHHHNTLVDICAPGYTVHALDYHRWIATEKYQSDVAGTSFAAPLVTGTIGLMLSASDKACLTPYQVEYLLKTKAEDDIYNLSANSYFANPKRLGAGRLDAKEAVKAASEFDCNTKNPEALTLLIEEIQVSNTCWTGNPATSNIQLTPIIKNGNGNYDYRWQYLSDNTVTIDDVYIANPTVTSSFAPHVIYLLLIIKEKNSAIPRVASKRIKVKLNTNTGKWDLAIKDAYDDYFNEPNDMDKVYTKNWDYWSSPWIWNTFGSSNPASTHNDPEYSTTTKNYLHIKVKNVGCVTSPTDVELKAYWTIAKSGERWAIDWTTGTMSGVNGTEDAGGEITSSSNPIFISALAKGAEQIITIEWEPINPADYVTGDKRVKTCILARLAEHSTTTPPYGLIEKTYTETGYSLRDNIRNNNNIATRNWFTYDYTSSKRSITTRIYFSNEQNSAQTYNLQLMNRKNIYGSYTGNLSAYMEGVIHLGDLYDVWVSGGYLGNPASFDEVNKTVTYDLSEPLFLNNLDLAANEIFPVDVELKLKDNIDVPEVVDDGMIHFRQTQMIIPEGEEEPVETVMGAISFSIAIDTMTDTTSQSKGGKSQPYSNKLYSKSTSQYISAFPNPAKDFVMFEYSLPETSGELYLTISNITGQKVGEISLSGNKGENRWDTRSMVSGIYIYKLSESGKTVDVGRIVISK